MKVDIPWFVSRQYAFGGRPASKVLYNLSRETYLSSYSASYPAEWVKLGSGLWVLKYDGAVDAHIANSAIPNLLMPVSVCIWVKNIATTDGTIFCIGRSGDNNPRFRFDIYNGTIRFRVSMTTLRSIGSDYSITDEKFIFVAGYAAAGEQEFSINGESQGTASNSDFSLPSQSQQSQIGAEYNYHGGYVWNRWANAFISPPRIWRRKVTVEEFRSIYQRERGWYRNAE